VPTCGRFPACGHPKLAVYRESIWANERDRTLFTSSTALQHSKDILIQYKAGKIQDMNDDLWKAKKIVDSTIHPGTVSHKINTDCGNNIY
jgi:hypothetical protein